MKCLAATEAQAFDPALVEALHVVLMDAAHHEISLDSLAVLPPQMAQGTVALRYLGTDARLVSTFDGLTKGPITPVGSRQSMAQCSNRARGCPECACPPSQRVVTFDNGNDLAGHKR